MNYLIFVDDEGFMMDFDLSGPVLKYTLRVCDAQVFDNTTQCRFTVNVNQVDPQSAHFVDVSTLVTMNMSSI